MQMPQRRAAFTVLLILMLVTSVSRCVATCAVASCSSHMPPCHQHQKKGPAQGTQVVCAPDVLLPDTVHPHLPQVSMDVPIVLGVNEAPPLPRATLSVSFDPSPGNTRLLSSVVLRI